MFEWIIRFFQGEPPPIAATLDDPVLGTLTWSEDGEEWYSDAEHKGVGFEFWISGTPEPNKALLAHAVDILKRKDDFVAEVLAHAKAEGETVNSLRSYREEIARLRIEGIHLCWPDRPGDGMIRLSGGQDYRAWRCDYIDRRPKGLCFDS